jgi:hypothetical protein
MQTKDWVAEAFRFASLLWAKPKVVKRGALEDRKERFEIGYIKDGYFHIVGFSEKSWKDAIAVANNRVVNAIGYCYRRMEID